MTHSLFLSTALCVVGVVCAAVPAEDDSSWSKEMPIGGAELSDGISRVELERCLDVIEKLFSVHLESIARTWWSSNTLIMRGQSTRL